MMTLLLLVLILAFVACVEDFVWFIDIIVTIQPTVDLQQDANTIAEVLRMVDIQPATKVTAVPLLVEYDNDDLKIGKSDTDMSTTKLEGDSIVVKTTLLPLSPPIHTTSVES